MTGTETTKTFQTRFEDLMIESGKTLREIANDTGISRAALNNYANDKAEIGINNVVKLAKYFNVSADYLLGLSDAKTNDKELQAICDYTGLSENNVIALHNVQDMDFINFMTSKLIEKLCNYVVSYNRHINESNEAMEETIDLINSLFLQSQDVRLKENHYKGWYSHISGLLGRMEMSDVPHVQHLSEYIELDIYRLLMETNRIIDEYFEPSKNVIESQFEKFFNDYQKKREKILRSIEEESSVSNPEKGGD